MITGPQGFCREASHRQAESSHSLSNNSKREARAPLRGCGQWAVQGKVACANIIPYGTEGLTGELAITMLTSRGPAPHCV